MLLVEQEIIEKLDVRVMNVNESILILISIGGNRRYYKLLRRLVNGIS